MLAYLKIPDPVRGICFVVCWRPTCGTHLGLLYCQLRIKLGLTMYCICRETNKFRSDWDLCTRGLAQHEPDPIIKWVQSSNLSDSPRNSTTQSDPHYQNPRQIKLNWNLKLNKMKTLLELNKMKTLIKLNQMKNLIGIYPSQTSPSNP